MLQTTCDNNYNESSEQSVSQNCLDRNQGAVQTLKLKSEKICKELRVVLKDIMYWRVTRSQLKLGSPAIVEKKKIRRKVAKDGVRKKRSSKQVDDEMCDSKMDSDEDLLKEFLLHKYPRETKKNGQSNKSQILSQQNSSKMNNDKDEKEMNLSLIEASMISESDDDFEKSKISTVFLSKERKRSRSYFQKKKQLNSKERAVNEKKEDMKAKKTQNKKRMAIMQSSSDAIDLNSSFETKMNSAKLISEQSLQESPADMLNTFLKFNTGDQFNSFIKFKQQSPRQMLQEHEIKKELINEYAQISESQIMGNDGFYLNINGVQCSMDDELPDEILIENENDDIAEKGLINLTTFLEEENNINEEIEKFNKYTSTSLSVEENMEICNNKLFFNEKKSEIEQADTQMVKMDLNESMMQNMVRKRSPKKPQVEKKGNIMKVANTNIRSVNMQKDEEKYQLNDSLETHCDNSATFLNLPMINLSASPESPTNTANSNQHFSLDLFDLENKPHPRIVEDKILKTNLLCLSTKKKDDTSDTKENKNQQKIHPKITKLSDQEVYRNNPLSDSNVNVNPPFDPIEDELQKLMVLNGNDKFANEKTSKPSKIIRYNSLLDILDITNYEEELEHTFLDEEMNDAKQNNEPKERNVQKPLLVHTLTVSNLKKFNDISCNNSSEQSDNHKPIICYRKRKLDKKKADTSNDIAFNEKKIKLENKLENQMPLEKNNLEVNFVTSNVELLPENSSFCDSKHGTHSHATCILGLNSSPDLNINSPKLDHFKNQDLVVSTNFGVCSNLGTSNILGKQEKTTKKNQSEEEDSNSSDSDSSDSDTSTSKSTDSEDKMKKEKVEENNEEKMEEPLLQVKKNEISDMGLDDYEVDAISLYAENVFDDDLLKSPDTKKTEARQSKTQLQSMKKVEEINPPKKRPSPITFDRLKTKKFPVKVTLKKSSVSKSSSKMSPKSTLKPFQNAPVQNSSFHNPLTQNLSVNFPTMQTQETPIANNLIPQHHQINYPQENLINEQSTMNFTDDCELFMQQDFYEVFQYTNFSEPASTLFNPPINLNKNEPNCVNDHNDNYEQRPTNFQTIKQEVQNYNVPMYRNQYVSVNTVANNVKHTVPSFSPSKILKSQSDVKKRLGHINIDAEKLYGGLCFKYMKYGNCTKKPCFFKHELTTHKETLNNLSKEMIFTLVQQAIRKNFFFYVRAIFLKCIDIFDYNDACQLFHIYSENCFVKNQGDIDTLVQVMLKKPNTSLSNLVSDLCSCVSDQSVKLMIFKTIQSKIKPGQFWDTFRLFFRDNVPTSNYLEIIIQECIMLKKNRAHIKDVCLYLYYLKYDKNINVEIPGVHFNAFINLIRTEKLNEYLQVFNIRDDPRKQFIASPDQVYDRKNEARGGRLKKEEEAEIFNKKPEIRKDDLEQITKTVNTTTQKNIEKVQQDEPQKIIVKEQIVKSEKIEEETSSKEENVDDNKYRVIRMDVPEGRSRYHDMFGELNEDIFLLELSLKNHDYERVLNILKKYFIDLDKNMYHSVCFHKCYLTIKTFGQKHIVDKGLHFRNSQEFWLFIKDLSDMKEWLTTKNFALAVEVFKRYAKSEVMERKQWFSYVCYLIMRKEIQIAENYFMLIQQEAVHRGPRDTLLKMLLDLGTRILIELVDNRRWFYAYNLIKYLKSCPCNAALTLFKAQIFIANQRSEKAYNVLRKTMIIFNNRRHWLVPSQPEDEKLRVTVINVLLQSLIYENSEVALILFDMVLIDQISFWHPIDLTLYVDCLALMLVQKQHMESLKKLSYIIMKYNILLRDSVFRLVIIQLTREDVDVGKQFFYYAANRGVYNLLKNKKINSPSIRLIVRLESTEEELYLITSDLIEQIVLNYGPALEHLNYRSFKVYFIFQSIPSTKRLYQNEIRNIENVLKKKEFIVAKKRLENVLLTKFSPSIRLIKKISWDRHVKLQQLSLIKYLKCHYIP